MSACHSWSSCTCNGWGKQSRSVSSLRREGSSGSGVLITCHCGDKAVLRTAKTTKNKGRKFWGCPKYKGGSEDIGCDYFKWYEDGVDEGGGAGWCEGTEGTRPICEGKQRTFIQNEEKVLDRMKKLEMSVKKLEKWVKVFVGIICVVFVMNLIMLYKLFLV